MENGQLLRKIIAPHWWDLSPEEAKIICDFVLVC